MNITCIATGSTGNSFLVETGKHRLLMEAGVSYAKTMEKIGFELPDAVTVTHNHADHAKYALAFATKGVPMICSNGTAEEIGILKWQKGDPKDFGVRILPAIHDTAEPSMFLVDNTDTGDRLLFATDTESIPHKIDGITHLVVECNHSMHTVADGNQQIDRARNSHLSLEVLLEWLEEQDTSKLKEVHLIHLSNDNSNEDFFEECIAKLLGVPVYVC